MTRCTKMIAKFRVSQALFSD